MTAALLRRPVWILHVLVVGLAVHNLAMAELWAAGVRGAALEAISAWKEALLALGLVLVLRAHGTLRFRLRAVDLLALAYGAVVVLYAVLPQGPLGGHATRHGVLLGLREELLPVGAYLFGRGLDLTRGEARAVGRTVLVTALGVAAFGLVDVYAVPLSWWRSSGAPGWFHDQLGFDYHGLSGLPENFVYNAPGEHPLRRLVSTFLSPLASSYLLVCALLLVAVAALRWRLRAAVWAPASALLGAGLLWTHSRSSYLALALGLVVLAWAEPGRRVRLGLAAVAAVGAGFAFLAAFPHIGPSTSFTRVELDCQRRHALHPERPMTCAGYRPARALPAGAPARMLQALAAEGPSQDGLSDASTESHWRSLKDGISTVVHHPQGYGLGNAGSTAARTGAAIKAGESTYTQLGVDAGLAGALLFVAWSGALLVRLGRGSPWVAASLAAMLALGLQTDMLGAPWVVYVLWTLAGWRVSQVGSSELDVSGPDIPGPAT